MELGTLKVYFVQYKYSEDSEWTTHRFAHSSFKSANAFMNGFEHRNAIVRLVEQTTTNRVAEWKDAK